MYHSIREGVTTAALAPVNIIAAELQNVVSKDATLSQLTELLCKVYYYLIYIYYLLSYAPRLCPRGIKQISSPTAY